MVYSATWLGWLYITYHPLREPETTIDYVTVSILCSMSIARRRSGFAPIFFMPFSIKSVAPQSQVTGDQKQRQRHPSSRHKPFPSSLEKRLHEMPTHIWLLSTCALIIIANIYPRLTIANTFFLIPQRGQAVARCGRIQRRNQIRFANFQYLSRDPMFSIFDAENRHDWWNLVVNFKDSRNTFLFCHRTLFVLKRINKKNIAK